MKIIISLPTLIALLLCNNFGNGAEVDFKRDIAPLLKAKCIECHGLEKQKAGLRFDRKDLAFQGGDSGEKTINPGKPEDSLLIKMITVGREIIIFMAGVSDITLISMLHLGRRIHPSFIISILPLLSYV